MVYLDRKQTDVEAMRNVVDGGAAQRRGRVVIQLLAGRNVDRAGHDEHGGESEKEAH